MNNGAALSREHNDHEANTPRDVALHEIEYAEQLGDEGGGPQRLAALRVCFETVDTAMAMAAG